MVAHEKTVALDGKPVATGKSVRAEKPNVAERAYRCRGSIDFGDVVCPIRLCVPALALDENVDFAHLEAGHLNIEIEIELRQKLEFLREDFFVPTRKFG